MVDIFDIATSKTPELFKGPDPTAASLVQEAIDQIIEARKLGDVLKRRSSPLDVRDLECIDDCLFNALKALGI